MQILVIVLSLLMGLSFILGDILTKVFKSKKTTYFATGLAFVIILAVLFTDIIPEIIELSTNYSQVWMTASAEVFGIFILIIIDMFIPHHHHEHKHNDDAKKEHKDHLYHIGVLTFISVLLHNVLEGIAFYMIGKESINSALLMAGGIALHNIPLGVEMSSFMKDKNKTKNIKNISLILSGTLGALIGLLLGDIGSTANLIILSITCGMMLYIGFLELGVESVNEIKEKGVIEGILIGAIIFALLLF